MFPRALSFVIHAIPLLVYLTVFTAAVITIRYHYDTALSNEEAEIYDLFVISSYYYETSKSLGNNSVALVLTGDFDIYVELKQIEITAWNTTDSITVAAPIQRITPHNVCRWISMFVTVPLLPNLSKLAISTGDKLVQIPFSPPVVKRYEVVSCIAPLFANEQWQLALFAAHTYRRFGSHMHLYIRSMISPLFELMKIYEKEGYLTIQPWLRIHLMSIAESRFNPNINIEFRNQAAAQTDCLLQYKIQGMWEFNRSQTNFYESASFISFVDLDDILIPRLGRTYEEEYSHLFNSMPNAAYLHYNKENVHIEAGMTSGVFSLDHMYSSIEFRQKTETGKLVTRPEFINSTWIHWPSTVADGMESYNVPNDVNALTHLKKLNRVDSVGNVSRVPLYEPIEGLQLHPATLLTKNDIRAIQNDYIRMSSKKGVPKLLKRMPTVFFYYNLIEKCFHDTFYSFHYSGQQSKMKCPGPDRCQFPVNPGIECYNSQAKYHSIEGTIVNLHFHTQDSFNLNDGCNK